MRGRLVYRVVYRVEFSKSWEGKMHALSTVSVAGALFARWMADGVITALAPRGLFARLLLQVGPEQAICNMLEAIKGWTSILVIASAIAIGFALILRGLAPEFSNQFQGAIRSVIVGLIIIAVLPMIATFILTSLGATGTGTGCTS